MHGCQIPPDISASKLIDQLTKVLHRAKKTVDLVSNIKICIIYLNSGILGIICWRGGGRGKGRMTTNLMET